MTASNVIPLRPHAPRPTPDDTLRADCERLMRRLVRSRYAYEFEMRDIADLLDVIVTRTERMAGEDASCKGAKQ